MCMSLSAEVIHCTGADRGQKKVLDHLKLAISFVSNLTWELGSRPYSS